MIEFKSDQIATEMMTTCILYRDAMSRLNDLMERDRELVKDIYAECFNNSLDMRLVNDKIYLRQVNMEDIYSIKHEIDDYANQLFGIFANMTRK